MNGPNAPPHEALAGETIVPVTRPRGVAHRLGTNTRENLERWSRALVPAPRGNALQLTLPAVAAAIATVIVVLIAMFRFDVAGNAWGNHLPQSVRTIFEEITDLGLSGWFLIPFGFIVLCLAALISQTMPQIPRAVLTVLAARFGFLFLAIGVPGLFDTIVKRLIGRARPSVGGHDDPFLYRPFIWRPEYASLPSGHATTAAAAAIAIGALWPRSRLVMWLYALTIMLSRVIVQAHHPSDVIAGALVGAAGAFAVRRWFAARRLLFCARDLRPYAGPSWRRIVSSLRQAVKALQHPPETA